MLTVLTLEAELIRVPTFKFYNYVITNQMVGNVYRKDYPKPEDEKQALREVVIKIDFDILAMKAGLITIRKKMSPLRLTIFSHPQRWDRVSKALVELSSIYRQ